jgi:hypothetical protein
MGDVFKEQIIKRQPAMRERILRVLIIVLAAVIVFLAMTLISAFGPIISFGVVFGAWYLLTFFNIEYEYVFTSGELDIDVIYNKSRRKRLFSGNVNQFELMCHIEDNMRNGGFTGAESSLDYSAGPVSKNTYAFLTLHKGKRTKIIFEPNEKILKAIAGVMSRQKLFIST